MQEIADRIKQAQAEQEELGHVGEKEKEGIS